MDVETIARKLEPLKPEEVGRWRRVRDTADADLKSLLDKQIVSLAYKELGDFHKKFLLSLPPEKKAKGSIQLGEVLYEKAKWDFGILRGELLQNLAIFGRSGAGKTNVAFHLLKQLVEKDIPFLFLDWKRTGRHLIPKFSKRVNVYTPGRSLSPFPFNPFIAPPGLEINVYINHVVDIMAEAFTLGDGAKSILQKAITKCYESGVQFPTANDLLKYVEELPAKERAKGWKISAIRALESIDFSQTTSANPLSQQELIKALMGGNTIIELDGLAQGSKKFLIPMLCLWIYYVRLPLPKRESLQLAIFIEESHHILYRQENKAKESVMNMLLRQCREIGIGMIVVDQHPSLISSAALGNTYTSICLNQKNPTDLNKAAALSLVDESEKKWFSMLPVGQGIVKMQDRFRKPFLVQFPLVIVDKGLVTDEVLKKYIEGNKQKNRRPFTKTPETIQPGGPSQNFNEDYILNEHELRLLEDIVRYEEDGVVVRYKRLGFSSRTGERLKRGLIVKGWLLTEVASVGKTRKVLLRLTHKAQEALGLHNKNMDFSRESLTHRYWKHFYARRFSQRGYQVAVEAPRQFNNRKSTGEVDILACKNGRRIGIEIETGKSDVSENVRNCLRAGFDQVIVVATDRKAQKRVEQELVKADFNILSRVQIVLAGSEVSETFDR